MRGTFSKVYGAVLQASSAAKAGAEGTYGRRYGPAACRCDKKMVFRYIEPDSEQRSAYRIQPEGRTFPE